MVNSVQKSGTTFINSAPYLSRARQLPGDRRFRAAEDAAKNAPLITESTLFPDALVKNKHLAFLDYNSTAKERNVVRNKPWFRDLVPQGLCLPWSVLCRERARGSRVQLHPGSSFSVCSGS